MKKKIKKIVIIATILLFFVGLGVALFVVFFDEAVLVRKGTVYRVPVSVKAVALTFDDGPSPTWTPKILEALRKAKAKATFFMLGEHAEKYPDVARQVVKEGHEVGNHTYDHHVLLYYTPQELEDEIKKAERVIKEVTGYTTRLIRPPKAWLTDKEKKQIAELGYKVVLWSLNSKDWVTFDDMYIRKYILRHVQPGDIILFHDSGGTFSTEGGDRHETVGAIPRLVEQLRERGYEIVTVSELLRMSGNGAK